MYLLSPAPHLPLTRPVAQLRFASCDWSLLVTFTGGKEDLTLARKVRKSYLILQDSPSPARPRVLASEPRKRNDTRQMRLHISAPNRQQLLSNDLPCKVLKGSFPLRIIRGFCWECASAVVPSSWQSRTPGDIRQCLETLSMVTTQGRGRGPGT